MEALWRSRCAAGGNAPALVFEDRPGLSCSALDQRVGALAAALRIAGAGAGRAAAMVVSAPDDEWEVVAMLACLAVQAPWCPADEERLEAIVNVARPACVLLRAATFAERRGALLHKLHSVRTVVILSENGEAVRVLDVWELDAPPGESAGGESSEPVGAPTVWAADALYILCTSGTSQGVPRAVVGSERATAARLEWGRQTLGPMGVALRRTPALFVDSITEVFQAVLMGGALYVARAATLRDLSRLLPCLGVLGVTHVTLTPSILQALLRFVDAAAGAAIGGGAGGLAAAAPRLVSVVCSGEPLPLALRDAFAASAPGVRLVNIWGCTECAADATYAVVSGEDCQECRHTWKRVPIGSALESCSTVRLARELASANEAFDADSDELIVGGLSQALGYAKLDGSGVDEPQKLDDGAKRADGAAAVVAPKSGARFVAVGTERYVMTADRGVRCGTCAGLHCLGRLDDVVKIRGIRVAVVELEAQCGLGADFAIVYDDGRGDAARARLVAFAVDVDSANAAIAALPEMHRPSLCVRVDAMPRGPTGKVDRRRLLSDLRCGGGGARSRRENVYEEWVLQLLEGLVGATFDDDAVSTSTFYEQGGTSLLAIEATSRIAQKFGAAPTPTQFAELGLESLAQGVARAVVEAGTLVEAPLARPDAGAPPAALPLARPAAEDGAPTKKRRVGVAEDAAQERSEASSARCDIFKDTSAQCDVWARCGGVPGDAAGSAKIAGAKCSAKITAAVSCAAAWRVPLGACVDAPPLAVRLPSGLAAFIGSHAKTFARIDVQSGAVNWSTAVCDRGVQNAVLADASLEGGASLSCDSKVVAVGCYDGCLYGMDVEMGRRLWVYAASAEIKSAALSRRGEFIFGSHDRRMHCVDCQTGALKWRTDELDGAVFATPTACGDIIIAATLGGSLYGLSRDEVWHWRGTSPVFSAPVVFEKLVLFGCVDGSANCLDAKTGVQKWGFLSAGSDAAARAIFAPPCVWAAKRKCIFASNDGQVTCRQVDRGAKVWTLSLGHAVFGAPCLASAFGGVIACCATTKGDVFLIDAACGAVLAKHAPGGAIFSSPILLPHGDDSLRILVGSRDDHLHAIDVFARR
ncbi:hypothetical protein M885DRAFT_526221 [Pelagophyceae sp. CCMP2097]|nr:hypothetical protein M885DRAFT_526221 [Pelagophyceae sp. CCMP2097]